MTDRTQHDLIFRGALVVDGSGNTPVVADLAISDDRISGLGDLSEHRAGTVVDARGRALAPGFIDAHCHDDGELITGPLLTPKISQGVTTVVNGNCGISLAPTPAGLPPGPPPLNLVSRDGSHRFERFADYFAALTQDPAAVNSVCLAGHTSLRHAAMTDLNQSANNSELTEMSRLLDEAMSDGAIGMSTGTYYPPAAAASTDELIALSKVMASHNGLYVTHMRDEANDIHLSLEETFRIGSEAGVRVIISHHKCVGSPNFGRSVETLAAIDTAAQGQTVWLDAYPYAASSTILQADRVQKATRVMVTWSSVMPEATGRDLAELAHEMNCSPVEAAERLMPGGAIYFQMDEADVQRILSHEHTMIGSDGIIGDQHPHPRAWGSFPRVLGHYSRDLGLFSLQEAVRKMTSLPANRFGMTDRGLLQVGAFADVVLFDPAVIIDSATFEQPAQPAAGIETVLVNGRRVWDAGSATGARPGRVLHA
ncbi:MAG: amidohydrolase family protein [Burkholderiaceae bacterium]